jgi:uncharacterized membrane protein
MVSSIWSLNGLKIGLTLFYGQLLSTGVYQYLIQGIAGFIHRQRAMYDSVLLLVLGLLMIIATIHAIASIWYHRQGMSIVACLILILILILTLAKSITEFNAMAQHPLLKEWMTIRITELFLRVLGVIGAILFVIQLKRTDRSEAI